MAAAGWRCINTPVDPAPVALTPEFSQSATAATQWRAFLRGGKLASAPEQLAEVVAVLAEFLLPVAASSVAGTFDQRWAAPGPWRTR